MFISLFLLMTIVSAQEVDIPYCGDGKCDWFYWYENCNNCPEDCHLCIIPLGSKTISGIETYTEPIDKCCLFGECRSIASICWYWIVLLLVIIIAILVIIFLKMKPQKNKTSD